MKLKSILALLINLLALNCYSQDDRFVFQDTMKLNFKFQFYNETVSISQDEIFKNYKNTSNLKVYDIHLKNISNYLGPNLELNLNEQSHIKSNLKFFCGLAPVLINSGTYQQVGFTQNYKIKILPTVKTEVFYESNVSTVSSNVASTYETQLNIGFKIYL